MCIIMMGFFTLNLSKIHKTEETLCTKWSKLLIIANTQEFIHTDLYYIFWHFIQHIPKTEMCYVNHK